MNPSKLSYLKIYFNVDENTVYILIRLDHFMISSNSNTVPIIV